MCSSTRRKSSSKLIADFFEPRVSYGARLTPDRLALGSHPAQSRPRVTARKNALVRWTSVLHHSMQTEIGRQLRAEYELPQELSTELASSLARLDKSLAFAGAAPPEVRLRFYKCESSPKAIATRHRVRRDGSQSFERRHQGNRVRTNFFQRVLRRTSRGQHDSRLIRQG